MRLAPLIALLLVTLISAAFADDAPSRERSLRIHLGGATLAGTPEYLTVDELERLPQRESRIYDPYMKEEILYRGVPLDELIARYASPETARVQIRAIDDYMAEFLRPEWKEDIFLLALRMNGERMGRAQSGPAKIVLQKKDPWNQHVQKWIWMIDRIDFSLQ